jgi:hypothetical protein
MKKAKNYILGILAIIFYVQIRLIRSVWINRGVPSIEYWTKEKYMVFEDMALLTFVWINLILLYFFGFWITLAIFALEIITILVFVKLKIKKTQ